MQDFLRNSGLDRFVASSAGALQKFWIRCEVYILEFGEREERRLTQGMSERKITIGLDEMFRARRPCLVAMEAVSNYIFIEKFTKDRTAATWKKELEQRLKGSNFQIGTVVSDLCGAITCVTESIGATHSPDLFHGQYEISKATSASLGSQERAAEKALIKAEEELKKLSKKPRKLIKDERKQQEIATCKKKCDDLKIEHAKKKERREKTKAANKDLGKIHHPIDLKNGSLQSADTVAAEFKQQLDTIEKQVKEAKLSESCFKRIEKARRSFALMVDYMRSFFLYFLPA